VSGVCALCGTVGAIHCHHLTGRSAPGAAYLDSALTIALCPACHADVHQAVRAAGHDFPFVGGAFLAHRVARAAFHCELLGSSDRSLILSPAAARGLGLLLRDVVGALDRERLGVSA